MTWKALICPKTFKTGYKWDFLQHFSFHIFFCLVLKGLLLNILLSSTQDIKTCTCIVKENRVLNED